MCNGHATGSAVLSQISHVDPPLVREIQEWETVKMLSKRNKFKNQVIIFVSDVGTDIGGYGKSYGSQSAQTMA